MITWTFDDGNGNSIDVDQNVIITDVTDPETPTLADLIGECSVTAVAPTTTDACAGIITGTTADALTYSSQGTYVITWNFDDGNGNSINVTQNVIIDDVTPPTAICPDNVITCYESVSTIGLSEVNDNCTIPTITYELSGATSASGTGDASIQLFSPGETTVTYTLDDGNGNSSQCAFTVTYEEVEEIIVSNIDGTLTAETAGSYQWMNCEDNSIIDGQTENTFAPRVNGDYAVIVTQGVCVDTSECYTLDYTGLDNNGIHQGFEVYPNPAEEYVTIDMGIENTNAIVKVVNMMGQTVVVERLVRLTRTDLDVSRFKPGMYLIQINSDQINGIVRVIKE